MASRKWMRRKKLMYATRLELDYVAALGTLGTKGNMQTTRPQRTQLRSISTMLHICMKKRAMHKISIFFSFDLFLRSLK